MEIGEVVEIIEIEPVAVPSTVPDETVPASEPAAPATTPEQVPAAP